MELKRTVRSEKAGTLEVEQTNNATFEANPKLRERTVSDCTVSSAHNVKGCSGGSGRRVS